MNRMFYLGCALLLGAGAQAAEPLSGKEARKLVFSPKKAEVEILAADLLSEGDRAILQQIASQQPYYGAVAISPDEGLAAEASVAAANYHDVDAARAVALSGCNDRRKSGAQPCVIVAEIRPEGWEGRALQLSADATRALTKEYRKAGKPRALAISAATGKWAVAGGADAAAQAVADCARLAATDDCVLAVTD